MKKQPRKNSAESDRRAASHISDTGLQRALVLACVAYAVLRVAASFAGGGSARVWGIDYASYLIAQPDILIALALPFLALLPGVERRAAAWLTKPATGRFQRLHGLMAVICIAVAGGLVASFSIPFPYLGDAPYYLGDTFRAVQQTGPQTGMIKPMAFLTGHLLVLLLGSFRFEELNTPFLLLGIGGSSIVVASLFFALRREKRLVAVLIAVLILAAPATLMFFGYLELYALSYALVVSYFLFLWSALRHGTHAAIPGVLLALAVGFGASAVVFVPSYLVLLVWKYGAPRFRIGPARAGLLLSALMLVGFAGMFLVIDTGNKAAPILPLVPSMIIGDTGEAIGVQPYSVLSPAHLADVANVLLLNLGVLLFLLLAFAVRGWRSMDRSDPALAVFGTAAVGGFPIWFAGQSYFGLGRDWDVMTAPVFAIAMLGVALLVRAHERKLIDLARLAPLLLAIAVTGLFLWLRPNMNAAASAARFEDLIAQNAPELLPRESFVAYEHLRKYYQSTGEAEKTMRVLRSMAGTKHLVLESYRRVFIALANARHSPARERDFAWLLEHLVDDARHFGQLRPKDIGDARDFDEFATRAFIGAAQAGYPELARRYQPQFTAARPSWTGPSLLRASGDVTLSTEEAASLLRGSVTDSTRDAELLIIAAGAYQQKGMDDEAIAHVERAIARQPVYYPKWYLALAGMYHQKGRASEEADVLRRCVANCPGTPEAEEARRLLDTPAEAPAPAR